jgi:hypothetical protein
MLKITRRKNYNYCSHIFFIKLLINFYCSSVKTNFISIINGYFFLIFTTKRYNLVYSKILSADVVFSFIYYFFFYGFLKDFL